MTLDSASGADLLAEARRTLLEAIVPFLPAHLRYEGLMVANAMAIAMREIIEGNAATEAVLHALAGLYNGATSAPTGSGAYHATLAGLERRLASDIRVGMFDAPGPARDQVRLALQTITAARLRLSNPKVLAEEPQYQNK